MPPNDSDSLTDQPDYDAHQIRIATTFVAAIFMILCCLVGLFGNLMSTVIFLHPLMRSPINVLLAGLSLIDLTMILLSVLVLIMPGLNLLIQNAALWKAYGFTTVFLYPLCTAAHTSSIWTFVLVSIERYNATCKPLKRHKLLTCRQARMAQTFVVVLALCYNSVRMWEYRDSPPLVNSTAEPAISVEPYLRLRMDYFISYYTILYVLSHCVIPFAIILILNIFIVRSVRYTDRYLALRALTHNPGAQSRQVKQQRNTTNMIIVITVLFTLCNICPFVLYVWEAVDPSLFYGHQSVQAYLALDLSNTFVLFNSSITFLIYIVYCQRYRVLFKHFLKSPCRCYCFGRAGPYYAAAMDLACDPSFRRYSAVTNSGCGEGAGVEMAAVIYAFYAKRRPSVLDPEAHRVVGSSSNTAAATPELIGSTTRNGRMTANDRNSVKTCRRASTFSHTNSELGISRNR